MSFSKLKQDQKSAIWDHWQIHYIEGYLWTVTWLDGRIWTEINILTSNLIIFGSGIWIWNTMPSWDLVLAGERVQSWLDCLSALQMALQNFWGLIVKCSKLRKCVKTNLKKINFFHVVTLRNPSSWFRKLNLNVWLTHNAMYWSVFQCPSIFNVDERTLSLQTYI